MPCIPQARAEHWTLGRVDGPLAVVGQSCQKHVPHAAWSNTELEREHTCATEEASGRSIPMSTWIKLMLTDMPGARLVLVAVASRIRASQQQR